MKRYFIDAYIEQLAEGPVVNADMVTTDDGEWVRHADAQAEIDRLRAENDILVAAVKDTIHSIENDDKSWIAGSLVLLRAALKPNSELDGAVQRPD